MKRPAFILLVGIIFFPFFGTQAHAASLTFSSAVNLRLTSPTTTLTVATSSVADTVTLNAGSVVVSMSSGESFTLTSPSYNLSISTSTGNGTASSTCSGGITTAVLNATGAISYTLTPSGTSCTSNSPPVISGISASNLTSTGATISWTTNISADSTVSYGTSTSYGATSTDATDVTSHTITLSGLLQNQTYHFAVISSENGTSTMSGDNTFTTSLPINSGGGGGGLGCQIDCGGSNPITSSTASVSNTVTGSTGGTSTSTFSAGSSSDELASLIAELCALVAQAQAQHIALSSTLLAECSLPQSGTSGGVSGYLFTRNLYRGIEGNDVWELQKFLISKNKGPAARALAKQGTTDLFASLTFAALKEFQAAVDISPVSGYFGPITRAYVNAHD